MPSKASLMGKKGEFDLTQHTGPTLQTHTMTRSQQTVHLYASRAEQSADPQRVRFDCELTEDSFRRQDECCSHAECPPQSQGAETEHRDSSAAAASNKETEFDNQLRQSIC